MRCAVVMLCLSLSAGASAQQVQRTFVSGTGNDANPCSRTAPCRDFAAAMANTLAGGEVVALDSAGYGPVTIQKSVALIAPPGVYAGITSFAGDAIFVQNTQGNVVLRGLSINGEGGAIGIDAQGANTLHVEGCEISRFTNAAVTFGPGLLFVNDTIIRDNALGVVAQAPSGSGVSAVSANHCRFENNSSEAFFIGDLTGAGSAATVSDSVFTQNGGNALRALTAELNVQNCVIARNSTGVATSAGATVTVAGSILVDNGIAFNNFSGTFNSFGNNQLQGNANPNFGTITTLGMQ